MNERKKERTMELKTNKDFMEAAEAACRRGDYKEITGLLRLLAEEGFCREDDAPALLLGWLGY
jgi:hypothetical protein